MTYLHERERWPDFRWDCQGLMAPLAATRHRMGLHLGRMGSVGFDLRQEAQLATLTEDVVTSAAIEGEALPPDEVRSSLAGRLGIDAGGLPAPSREVEGLVAMMLDATQAFHDPLTAERLFGWHAALFPTGRSGAARITVGAWRPESADPMRVISGAVGRERVHFEAPGGARLPEAMSAFLLWFDAAPASDPVLKAAVAHLWFITIHPFEDGNGRIARAITDMALARADATAERFYSMSSQIEAERNEYYTQLEAAQRGPLEITPWLMWFVGCLDRALEAADSTLADVLRKARLWKTINLHPIQARQRTVLERMLEGFDGFLTTSKYAKLAKCSSDTALRDIRELLAFGILVKNAAGGRSVSYRLVE